MSLLSALPVGSGCLLCMSLNGSQVAVLLGLALLAILVITSPFLFCAAMAVRRHRRFAWLDCYDRFRGSQLAPMRGCRLEVHGMLRQCSVKNDAWDLTLQLDGGEMVQVRELRAGDDTEGDPAGQSDARARQAAAWRCHPEQRVSVLGTVGLDYQPDGYRGIREQVFIDAVQVQPPGRVARWRMAALGWAAAGSAWLFLLIGLFRQL
jgi:hypothetical protein